MAGPLTRTADRPVSLGGPEVSVLQLDRAATSDAQSRLAGAEDALGGVATEVTAAATLAALDGEQAAVLALLAATQGQVDSVRRLLGLTADRASNADASFSAMLDGWIGSIASTLRNQINDDTGTSVAGLLAQGALQIDEDALRALDADGAEAWFESLSEAERLDIVARYQDLLDNSAAAGTADAWKDELDADALQALFTIRALDRAGIDPSTWDPALGLEHNAVTIEAVYEYYSELYRNDPDRLWWSGMAALIGPSFYGGFQDLETFTRIFDAAAQIQGGPIGSVLPGGIPFNQLSAWGSREMADELQWYQRQLMSMQQEIFYDMAPAHEAYLDGGPDMIARFYDHADSGIDAATIAAWAQLDEGWRTGDTTLIAAGNETLLWREQSAIIADDYDLMRNRPVTGELVTWAMTAIGAPSVPGAQSYPEVFPQPFDVSQYVGTPRKVPEPPLVGWILPDVPLPHIGAEGTITIETPLPDGNISRLDDRWALIEEDTLPVYLELAEHRSDEVIAILDDSVGVRAVDFTIQHRIDDLIDDAVTNWGVDFDVDIEIGW